MGYIIDDNTVLLLKGEDTADYFNNIESISGFEIVEEGKFNKGLKCINTSSYGRINFKDKVYSFLPKNNIFTIDFWFKIDNPRNGTKYLLKSSSSTSYVECSMYLANSQWYLTVNGSNVSGYIDYIEGYHHIAIQSDGTTTTVYFDGVKQTAKAPANRALLSNSTTYWDICKSDAATSSYPECYVYIDELRISNCVRYTEDFIPNNKEYSNPLYPNILNSTEILCSVVNERAYSKLEVYVNNVLDTTYTDLPMGNITIHKYNTDLIAKGEANTIKVVGYIDDIDYPVEFTYKDIPPLSYFASINTILERFNSFIERQKESNNVFSRILKEKGVLADFNGLRHEELIEYVRILGNAAEPEESRTLGEVRRLSNGYRIRFTPYLDLEGKFGTLYVNNKAILTGAVTGDYITFNDIAEFNSGDSIYLIFSDNTKSDTRII